MVLWLLSCFFCNSFILTYVILPAAIIFGIKYKIKKSLGKVDPENEIDISGKTVIITGASDGIGKDNAEQLALRGAKVILACRNKEKTQAAIEDIRTRTGNGELIFMELDLSSLASVRSFAKEYISKYGGSSNPSGLSILINNAGVQNPIGVRKLTKDGFEESFGVNHLGHFLLTQLLLPDLERAAAANTLVASRIVNVGSETHQFGKLNFHDLMYDRTPFQDLMFLPLLYCNSKLANGLFTLELAKRLRAKGVNVNTYTACPGVVHTNLRTSENAQGAPPKTLVRSIMLPILEFFVGKNVKEGAQTTLYCALSKYLEHHSGEMYQNVQFWDYSKRPKLTEEDAARLWEISEKLVNK